MSDYRTKLVQDELGCWQAHVFAGDDVEPVYVSLPYAGADGKRRAQSAAKWFTQEGDVKQPKLF